MSRTHDRAHAFKLVFALGFDTDESGVFGGYFTSFAGLGDDEQPQEPALVDRYFVEKEFNGVLAHLADIDAKIAECDANWAIERLAKTDLAILRLAVFEMLYGGVPKGAAVNEAVELAKIYSPDNSPNYVHSVLAEVEKRYIKNDE